jgi:hypothetical protein
MGGNHFCKIVPSISNWKMIRLTVARVIPGRQ